MNLRANIKPRYVIAATAAFAILMISTAVIELKQSRDELYHLMREEAVSLAEAIDRSGANVLLSMDQIQGLLGERLLNNAYYIARLDSAGELQAGDLATFASANDLFRVNIFDRRGRKIMSSYAPSQAHASLPEKYSPAEVLEPILRGRTDRLVIGLKEARIEEGQRYAVAIRRTHRAGGAIVVNMDAADLLTFRRTIGIGKLIQDLADNSGIAYVALQDTQGIIAASGGVKELSSIPTDPFIVRAIAGDTTLTRVIEFDGTEVFEVARSFEPAGSSAGVLRIGLAMNEVRNAEARMLRRMIMMSLVVIVIGSLAIVFIMAQQNFRVMEQKYASIKSFTGNILTQMRDGVVTVDPMETVTIFNVRAAEMLLFDTEGVEGRPLRDLNEGTTPPLKDIFNQPDGTSEISIDLRDGTRRIVAVSLSTTRTGKGMVESRTAVLRDLTEARRREREAQRKDKLSAMGELASGVAHEIRNPLNAIGMIAQRFGKEFTPRSGVKEYRALARVMQEEARRVNAIIRQFLSFARPPKLLRRPIDVKELVEHVASLFSAQAADAGVTFTVSTDAGATAHLDHDQMTQALLNLLQNALEATPRGGRIVLKSEPVAGGTQFTVSDTGKGIPPPLLDRIFNLYFTTRTEGTGLGLSITQQIVGQHGGTIDVASAEGKGTTITLVIPDTPPTLHGHL